MSLTPIPGFPCLTEKGPGTAYWVIDYGPEHHILWGVVMDTTGQIWWVPNDKIRAQKNISLGRVDPENISENPK